MKQKIFIVLACAAFSIASAAFAAPADFAGVWSFDREQSKGVPPPLAALKAFDLTVASANNSVKIDIDIDPGRADAGHDLRAGLA